MAEPLDEPCHAYRQLGQMSWPPYSMASPDLQKSETNQMTECVKPPFLWPDCRRLAACSGPDLNLDAVLADAQLLLGVVHDLTAVGVLRLAEWLKTKTTSDGNGSGQPSVGQKKARLVVMLYPTCPTGTDTLLELLHLQGVNPGLEVRLVTCGMLDRPEGVVTCYKQAETLPVMLLGSAAGFESPTDNPAHLTLAFTPEATLAADWASWFDVRWLQAVPLTQDRTSIPSLVRPQGTEEGARLWRDYARLIGPGLQNDQPVTVTVDPTTGIVSAKKPDGTPVTTISSEHELPKVSPVYRKLVQLFEKGHLVSIDKNTRLRPLEVPVKPKWFGLETMRQIGTVKREVSYRISQLREDELKSLENRRKKMSELLELFSFSLADGQRWMPATAETLFQQECKRINDEAKGILDKLVAGNLAAFMASRREVVRQDADRMYRELFPDRKLSDEALDEIMTDLRKRFEEAQQRSFLPKLSFCRVSLPPQSQAPSWKSQLGSAFHLLLSIVRYPRKAYENGQFFGRGTKVQPMHILTAMNVLDDPFTACFQSPQAKIAAQAELEECDAIESADAKVEDKCERLFALLGQINTPSALVKQSTVQIQGGRLFSDHSDSAKSLEN